jgi:high affinity sulfate transporter 1
LKGIRAADLPREVSSGLTLAALVIPLNIGYAQIAGLPPAMGLYAGIVPLVVFALFTASRSVVGGPGPATAALVAAALAGFAGPGDPQRVQYALALAMMCAVLFLLAWMFRLSFLQNFLSQAVMIGFVSGLGIQVFTSQARKILGVSIDISEQHEALTDHVQQALGMALETEGYFLNVIELIKQIPHANLYAVAIGLGSLFMVRLMKRYLPKVPGALVTLVVMTVVVVVFDLESRGVRVLGDLSAGLPSLTVPAIPMSDYIRLLPGAIAIVAITLCEGLLLARSYARKYGDKVDGDQVLFAYGLANASAGLSGSMVTGNSVSRSAAMDSAGVRTQLPSLVAAAAVAVIMAFFTGVLAVLPKAALAGIVANAVLSLIKVGDLRALYRMRRTEFWIAAVCLLSVLALGPLRAVVIAFLMSIIDLVRRTSQPYTTLLREAPDGHHFVPCEPHHMGSACEFIIYRFSAPLFFANSNPFLDEIEGLLRRAPADVKWFVLDAEGLNDMDTTGADSLREVIAMLEKQGVSFAVTRANRRLMESMKAYGLVDELGAERFFATNRQAVEAFHRDRDG